MTSLHPLPDFDASELRARALDALTDDIDRRLAEDAYVHPYGFTVIRLGDLDNGWGLRLHTWPEGFVMPKQTSAWAIHDHAWCLYSYVLTGRIEQRTYRVHDVAGDHSVYEVDATSYAAGASRLRLASARVACELVGTETIAAGDGYLVPPRAFHTSGPDGGAKTATLVATEPARGRRSRVVANAPAEQSVSFERRPPDLLQARRSIDEVVRALRSP